MKKVTILLTLLLCSMFSSISAQSVLRWSVSTPTGGATLKIKINGVVVVNIQQAQYASPQSGIIENLDNALIEYEATSTDSAPILCVTTETGLVDYFLDGYYGYWETHGFPPDPFIYSESGSWNSYDDYDWTIQLSTQSVN